MYDLLVLKDNMTVSEMAEFENNIPIAANKVKDNIALLEELCYRRDEVLIKSEGKVTRYRIEPLPKTDLSKIIVSVDTEHKGKYAINYKPIVIPFFGGNPSIQKLVLSEKVDSFCACHFEPSAKNPDGYRSSSYFKPGENMVVFDFDEGITIQEVEMLLENYVYILYTTSSHTEEQHKFRVVLPTKTTFYVEPEQHKELYNNLAEMLDIKIYDLSCTNAGRMFFTQNGKRKENFKPEDGILIAKETGDLLDISCCVPDTIKSENIMPVITNINEQVDTGEMSKREAGFVKWFISNTGEGNRNANLYAAGKFYKDLGSDYEEKVVRLNAMLNNPVDDAEIKSILSSVNRR
jgi:hypothetical protein